MILCLEGREKKRLISQQQWVKNWLNLCLGCAEIKIFIKTRYKQQFLQNIRFKTWSKRRIRTGQSLWVFEENFVYLIAVFAVCEKAPFEGLPWLPTNPSPSHSPITQTRPRPPWEWKVRIEATLRYAKLFRQLWVIHNPLNPIGLKIYFLLWKILFWKTITLAKVQW